MGWFVDPQGLYKILMKLKSFSLPVIITENGTSEDKPEDYESFLIEHLMSVAKAISNSVDIQGYFWWSLLDNFEWDKGFKKRFGLIGVDYSNMARQRKPFSYTYANICRKNKINF